MGMKVALPTKAYRLCEHCTNLSPSYYQGAEAHLELRSANFQSITIPLARSSFTGMKASFSLQECSSLRSLAYPRSLLQAMTFVPFTVVCDAAHLRTTHGTEEASTLTESMEN